jgi:hypothetical protein
MTSGQQDQPKRRKRAKGGNRKSGALIGHRAFAPIMGLWGAALGGLPVMVLPPALIASNTHGTTIALLNGAAQPVLAGLAAVVVGGALFGLVAPMSARARRKDKSPSIAAMATRRVRPIDPVRDLGSRSLDDPLESMPFATPAWRDASVEEPQAQPEAQPEAPRERQRMRQPQPAPAPAPAPVPEPVAAPVAAVAPQPAPRALELAEFAELPGRNAVWVEEVIEPAQPAAAPAERSAEPVAYAPVAALRPAAPKPETPLPEPGTAALARLRAVPPAELSLAEMVERFAGALHEHRTSPTARALTAEDIAAREAALVEALRALAALTSAPKSSGAGEPLRAALSRLQTQRGVA